MQVTCADKQDPCRVGLLPFVFWSFRLYSVGTQTRYNRTEVIVLSKRLMPCLLVFGLTADSVTVDASVRSLVWNAHTTSGSVTHSNRFQEQAIVPFAVEAWDAVADLASPSLPSFLRRQASLSSANILFQFQPPAAA